MSNVSFVKISEKFGLMSKVSNSVLELTLSFRSFSIKYLNKKCAMIPAKSISSNTATITSSITPRRSSLNFATTLFCCIIWTT